MPARTPNHAYADRAAFDRVLLLIATLLEHPGIGCPEPLARSDEPHDALKFVQTALRNYAQAHDIPLKFDSVPTLRKDLTTLRKYGILRDRKYRWGYYLGTGGLTWSELKTALNALRSLAVYQQDPLITRLYHQILRRLGLQNASDGAIYPVRTQINQAIMSTDPETMMRQGRYRQTLFEHLAEVEAAILQGQAIEIHKERQAHATNKLGYLQVWPLQLVYADVAWYLLYEEIETGLLAFRRLDRFSGHFRKMRDRQRSLEVQWQSLETAHQLRKQGWGLYLGQLEEQQLELADKLETIQVIVRFFDQVMVFIQEGDLRHPSQKIVPEPVPKNERPNYVDYYATLPPRSLREFSFWVSRHLDQAQFIAPVDWAKWHYEAARRLVQRYEQDSSP